jgi:Flp pilus assembly protein TadG
MNERPVTSRRQRGQSLVEFALVLPVLAVILCAILEFGMAFDADLALEAASRQGARVGAFLGNYGSWGVCPNAGSETVDPAIAESVATSLSVAGVDLTGVRLTIFLADASGNPTASKTVWSYDSGSHTFTKASGTWDACGRHDGTFGGGTYDPIGVRIEYTYHSKTGILNFFSGGLKMSATTVMPIGPPPNQ